VARTWLLLDLWRLCGVIEIHFDLLLLQRRLEGRCDEVSFIIKLQIEVELLH
jgi:hypothetical protein